MKKIFAFVAIAAMFAVACSKPANNNKPNDEQKPDNQEQEYAGPTEGTSDWSLIGAVLGSNWDKDYKLAASGDNFVIKNVKLAAADEFKIRFQGAWDANRGGAFAELGKGFAVENNGANIKPGLDGFYDIWYNPAVEQMAVCAKDAAPAWSEGGQQGGDVKSIEIDGQFEDWAALEPGTFSKTYGDEEAAHPALTHCKVYATAEKVYVYVEWDEEGLGGDLSWIPFHCYINTDGDDKTGGYADEFEDACSDVLLEGAVYADGEICSYWSGGYPWIGEANASGWTWAPDTDNIFGEESPTEGAGVPGKYEFSIDRKMFADAGFPIADEFSIGFDIQNSGWSTVGVLPCTSASEDNINGILPSLAVKTIK